MAQRRFVSRRLTESDKIGTLRGNDRARFIYVALLPYTDREGRLNANPLMLKSSALEGFEYTAEDIAAALDALAESGLIELYSAPRHKLVMQYTKFTDFNKPHDKEPASDLPSKGGSTTAREALRNAIRDVLGTAPEDSEKITGNDQEPSAVSTRWRESTSTRLSGEHSSDSEGLAERSQAPVAQARRAHIDYQEFIDVWNQQAQTLPTVQKLNEARRRGIQKLCKEHGVAEALGLLHDAAAQVATDDFWIERQFGFDNLVPKKVVEKAEKLRATNGMKPSEVKLAREAQGWLSATGGNHGN